MEYADSGFFLSCFEKHNFQELNSIDVDMLKRVMRFHYSLFPENNVFFDVGSNAGSFVRVLSELNVSAAIHCFEPHPVLGIMVQNKYPHVTMNQICLSNNNEPADMHFPIWSVGLSSLIERPVFSDLTKSNQGVKKFRTECVTLDKYCNDNNIDKIDFIKIDVEGAEKMVFEGAAKMLKMKRITAGVFEQGQTLIDAGCSGEEIEDLLKCYGYKIVKHLSNSDWYFHI